MPVEVVHYNPLVKVVPGKLGRLAPNWKRPINNFGDLIGPLLVDRMLEQAGLDATAGTSGARLVAVGSIMKLAEPGDVVWGTGINGKSMSVGAGAALDIRAVRGPLTRQLLVDAGASVPEVYGDPALLWPMFWPRDLYAPNGASDPVTVVPNFHDWKSWRRDRRAVNPRQDPHAVIKRIAASEFVCGSSLHGIIIAEAFGIPARLITPTTEPEFKYADYYRGTGRPDFRAARTLDEALELGGEPALNWDRQPLVDAFPNDLWQSDSARP